jgi:alpha-galactosidase
MKRVFALISVLYFLLSRQHALAVQPSAAERDAFNSWFKSAVVSGQQAAPISFIYDGVDSRIAMKNWRRSITYRALDRRRTAWTLRYEEPSGPLAVKCTCIVYHDLPALDWVVEFSNQGTAPTPILESIQAMDVVWKAATAKGFLLHHSKGEFNSAESFRPVQEALVEGQPIVLEPNGGRSSDGHMPFFNLQWQNQGVIMALGWSGQWRASFARETAQTVRVQTGLARTHLRLLPGETIRTPRMVLLFWQGTDDIRGNNLFRQLIIKHYIPHRDGKPVFAPICGSIDLADPDGSYEGPHLRTIPILAARGFEVFWSDMDPQHWYPGGFPDGTGTWQPDSIKYPRGLKPIGDAAKAAGLDYLLWFEPERVAPGTEIERLHPEWVMALPQFKYRLYTLQDSTARVWLTDLIDRQITAADLKWLRWDFNIEPLKFWQQNDAPDRQGMTEIRYIEGLYAMMDELMHRHPGMVIDVCASGGRRLDIETYKRGLPLWHSDMQCFGPNPEGEQLQNGGLFRWLPMHGTAAFGYEPSYKFRSAMTSGNIVVGHSGEYFMAKLHREEEGLLTSKNITLGPWRFVGPFYQAGKQPLACVFPPEQGVHLEERYENGTLAWAAQPEWQSGGIYYFANKDSSAYYLYRTIQSDKPQHLRVYLGCDDAMQVWLNKDSCFLSDSDHAVSAGQDSANLALQAGDNEVLIKIANNKGRSGFYFSTVALDARYGKLDTAFPETEPDVKRTLALYRKIRPFMLGDFFPLFDHSASDTSWYGYQFHREDLQAGAVVLFRRLHGAAEQLITLHGVAAEKELEVFSENTGKSETQIGPALKITILESPGSEIMFYKQKRPK